MRIQGLPVQEITTHFGSQFVSFLNNNNRSIDLETTKLVYAYSQDMSWAERRSIMDAIDDLKPEADRVGGRIAYMACFGSESWEAERRMLSKELATP